LRIHFISYGNIQTASEDGVTAYEYEAGLTANVPEDIAALFIANGVAEPAKAERAVKDKGETATK
jgi:hypothetical protein